MRVDLERCESNLPYTELELNFKGIVDMCVDEQSHSCSGVVGSSSVLTRFSCKFGQNHDRHSVLKIIHRAMQMNRAGPITVTVFPAARSWPRAACNGRSPAAGPAGEQESKEQADLI